MTAFTTLLFPQRTHSNPSLLILRALEIVAVPKAQTNMENSSAKPSTGTSVIGTLVSGLTDGDVQHSQHPHRAFRAAGSQKYLPPQYDCVHHPAFPAEDMLEDAEWDFESFKRDKLAWWVGADESEW
jgi:hypothetical protein